MMHVRRALAALAGYKAWAEAVGLHGDDGEWFAYETGYSDWWISYDGH
ncbi:hypothetical protein ACIHEI_25520 [Kitasatospora sp. NPDC051984]